MPSHVYYLRGVLQVDNISMEDVLKTDASPWHNDITTVLSHAYLVLYLSLASFQL